MNLEWKAERNVKNFILLKSHVNTKQIYTLEEYTFLIFMSVLYRLIPLRSLRRTTGVKFDDIVPSDIPKIDGVELIE